MNSRYVLVAFILGLGVFTAIWAKPVISQEPLQLNEPLLNLNNDRVDETLEKSLNPQDPKNLNEALIERRDVARKLVEAAKKEYDVGISKLEAVLLAQNVLLEAELALAKTKAERIEILKQRLKNLRQLEQEVATKYQIGSHGGSRANFLSAYVARLTGVVELLREQEAK